VDIYKIAVQIIVLIFAVIVHEVSHGYVAYKLGDPTAKQQGRLTLNPLPHIDPVWSILIPAFLIFTHAGFVIGGAKPVPINPMYFKHHRRDIMLTGFAGPGSNLLLALISILLMKLVRMIPGFYSDGLNIFLYYNVIINVGLAVFNLIPIPPLDGSKVLAFFLPARMELAYLRLERFGMIILIGLLATGLLGYIFTPIFAAVMKLLTLLL
jgi:Zn-dependent protease